MEITFLGTGTSYGVPILGCNCATCTSNDPKNIRYRSSIFIKDTNLSILIDTPPELRLQLLNNKIYNFDLVLFTHSHADHIMGFDDIRVINKNQNKSIPCYGNKQTINHLRHIFSYIFEPEQIGGGVPQVSLNLIKDDLYINNTRITPLPVKHGKLDILGYKINNKLAYITDCSHIPQNTIKLIKNVKILIIDALRYKRHSTHMNVEQALKVINKLNLDMAYFTHISHDIEHNKTNEELPENVHLAYDGMNIIIK